MRILGLTLHYQALRISVGVLSVAGIIVFLWPAIGSGVSFHVASLAPLVCGLLIGAVGVLATLLSVVYPAIVRLKDQLSDSGAVVLEAISQTTAEIKDNTLFVLYLTALVYSVNIASPLVSHSLINSQLPCFEYLRGVKNTVMLASLFLYIVAVIDVLKAMFTIIAVAHGIFYKEYKTHDK